MRSMSWVKMTCKAPQLGAGSCQLTHRLATARGQGDAQTTLTIVKMRQHRLYAILLILAQLELESRCTGGMNRIGERFAAAKLLPLPMIVSPGGDKLQETPHSTSSICKRRMRVAMGLSG